MHKNTTINITENGFKPFFKAKPFSRNRLNLFCLQQKRIKKRLKKDVLYAIRIHFERCSDQGIALSQRSMSVSYKSSEPLSVLDTESSPFGF